MIAKEIDLTSRLSLMQRKDVPHFHGWGKLLASLTSGKILINELPWSHYLYPPKPGYLQ